MAFDYRGIGLASMNDLFENIKTKLSRIAEIEISTGNLQDQFLNQNYSTYEELESILKAELANNSKANFIFVFFKYALIAFEGLSGYLAFGILIHAFRAKELLESDYLFIVYVIQIILAFVFSYAIISFSIRAVKKKSTDDPLSYVNFCIAFGSLIALPALNLGLIYFSGLDIINKNIYVISSIFTSLSGFFLILVSAKKSESEIIKYSQLKEFKILLKERKKLYAASKKDYSTIYKRTNEYHELFEDDTLINSPNFLYKGLLKFLMECENFDNWSYEFILMQKGQKAINRSKPFQKHIK